VIEKETVTVGSTEAPGLAASKLHAGTSAFFSAAGAICNDLEVRWDARSIVENVGNVVANS
jgi:hypothetical protein